eukprot:TRINITY_DN740_c1_g1_i1.p1 TRINITY_DN740_c1_g1~~TRINITY_DN740_c1_g1_i1.p1  ORF type:complete len:494 (+),score=125.72 TRINITY_DN740_c1_g1_i1:62-1543(+)
MSKRPAEGQNDTTGADDASGQQSAKVNRVDPSDLARKPFLPTDAQGTAGSADWRAPGLGVAEGIMPRNTQDWSFLQPAMMMPPSPFYYDQSLLPQQQQFARMNAAGPWATMPTMSMPSQLVMLQQQQQQLQQQMQHFQPHVGQAQTAHPALSQALSQAPPPPTLTSQAPAAHSAVTQSMQQISSEMPRMNFNIDPATAVKTFQQNPQLAALALHTLFQQHRHLFDANGAVLHNSGGVSSAPVVGTGSVNDSSRMVPVATTMATSAPVPTASVLPTPVVNDVISQTSVQQQFKLLIVMGPSAQVFKDAAIRLRVKLVGPTDLAARFPPRITLTLALEDMHGHHVTTVLKGRRAGARMLAQEEFTVGFAANMEAELRNVRVREVSSNHAGTAFSLVVRMPQYPNIVAARSTLFYVRSERMRSPSYQSQSTKRLNALAAVGAAPAAATAAPMTASQDGSNAPSGDSQVSQTLNQDSETDDGEDTAEVKPQAAVVSS